MVRRSVVYTVEGGKRCFHQDMAAAESSGSWPVFQTEVHVHPPQMMSPDTWTRHVYTRQDIVDTLSMYDNIYTWQLYLAVFRMFETIEARPQGIRLVSNTDESILVRFTSRKLMHDRLSEHFGKHDDAGDSNTTVLDRSSSVHVPFLPVYTVTAEQFMRVHTLLPDLEPCYLRPTVYEEALEVAGALFVPVFLQDISRICLHRVVEVDGRTRTGDSCPLTADIVVFCGGHRYILTEEACIWKYVAS